MQVHYKNPKIVSNTVKCRRELFLSYAMSGLVCTDHRDSLQMNDNKWICIFCYHLYIVIFTQNL